MNLNLDGKRAFVSGSSSGLGRATAIELAKQGCDVAVHGRDQARTEDTAKAVEDLARKAVVTIGDLATEDGCQKVAEETLASLEAIDIVVNNCGVALRKDDPPWSEITSKEWIDSYEVNFMSTVRMSQHFLPGIEAAGWGRFINISSISAALVPSLIDYGAPKAALNKLTADMSKDVARFGATANGLMPGPILTPAVEEWLNVLAEQNGWEGELADFERQYLTDIVPQSIKKFGRGEDVAALVAFLASPLARHITGVTIRIDGGLNKSPHI